jgi:hypothetical protein
MTVDSGYGRSITIRHRDIECDPRLIVAYQRGQVRSASDTVESSQMELGTCST